MVPLLLVLLLQFSQQLCGISIIICYTDELFSKVLVIIIIGKFPIGFPRFMGTA